MNIEFWMELIKHLPFDVKMLTLFGDGAFANYKDFQNPNSKSYLPFSIEEPSLILTALPIRKPENDEVIPELGYSPSYKGLTDTQRWKYLEFLCNPFEPIEIGYVFLFYYGLERQLVLGAYENASKMILRLREYHLNRSFQSHSYRALLITAISNEDNNTIQTICKSNLDKDVYYLNAEYILLGKYLLDSSLTIEDIMCLSKKLKFSFSAEVGRSSKKSLFMNYVTTELQNRYGQLRIPLRTFQINDSKGCRKSFLANHSISHEFSYSNFPNLLDNDKFRVEMLSILHNAAEAVKKDNKL